MDTPQTEAATQDTAKKTESSDLVAACRAGDARWRFIQLVVH